MKRHILISSLLLFSTLGAADFYVGADVGYDMMTQETQNDAFELKEDYSAIPASLKVGYGDSDGFSGELIYTFSSQNFENRDALIAQDLGLNLKYGFNVVRDLNIFMLAGASYGICDIELVNNAALRQESDLSSQSFLAYRGGLGMNYRINNWVEVLGGANYIFRDYEEMQISEKMPPLGAYNYAQTKSDSGVNIYIGVNFYFHSQKQVSSTQHLMPNDEFADFFENDNKK